MTCQAAGAFDALAAEYDTVFTATALGRVLRRRGWRTIDSCFAPGSAVLDLGCGTGADAVHLGRRGVRVVGLDASPAMVEVARRKVDRAGVAHRVAILIGALEDLDNLDVGHRAQGAVANFGVLNCIADLSALADALGRRLAPGARIVAVVMSPGCWWELTPLPVAGHRRRFLRRVGPGGIAASGPGGLEIRYPSPGTLAREMGPDYRLLGVRGLGLALPPTYLAHALEGRPGLLRLLDRVDDAAGAWPVARELGDHYVAEVEWRSR